ncbi:DNA adenine methylase [Lawsonibacter sp. LCP25S3_G6]|uniref:DNA adenine methylase n=1 Tax=unclassified Lawsonibacter TaxID=2617946 RepID=UPI003F96933F
MVQSPLNYTGGKYKLLPQILPLFPQSSRIFVDLFCGGCNVGLNVQSQQVIYNDRNPDLLHLYQTLHELDGETILAWVHEIIEHYRLSLVSRYGYAHYGCDSGRGLGTYNREGFLRLREDYNRRRREGLDDSRSHIMLYVLIVYAFNNQIRFNARGEFNLPVGKRDFNQRMEDKLLAFLDRIHSQTCTFTCQDFRDFDTNGLTGQDFVYADPPYLITCATYNEKGGWNEALERDLLAFLDRLHAQGVPFALSNVLRSKGRENTVLLQWLEQNRGTYRPVPLQYSYANSNYQTKDKTSSSEEVLILNY